MSLFLRIKKCLKGLIVGGLITFLTACALATPPAQERDYFPGGFPYYSYGTSQSKENFANIARAQSEYSPYPNVRAWGDIKPGAHANTLMLRAYYPLHVRWQLKDGRQFIAENIDVRAIMREYFKHHDITLPWQREGRPYDSGGDYDPTLVEEVKDDTVILKWRITTNHTPVNERFAPSGAVNHWRRTHEEYFVAAIKGTPTSGIDFEKWYVKTKQ